MKRRQTYPEYLETMKAYRFSPLDYETWKSWDDFYRAKREGKDSVRMLGFPEREEVPSE